MANSLKELVTSYEVGLEAYPTYFHLYLSITYSFTFYLLLSTSFVNTSAANTNARGPSSTATTSNVLIQPHRKYRVSPGAGFISSNVLTNLDK